MLESQVVLGCSSFAKCKWSKSEGEPWRGAQMLQWTDGVGGRKCFGIGRGRDQYVCDREFSLEAKLDREAKRGVLDPEYDSDFSAKAFSSWYRRAGGERPYTVREARPAVARWAPFERADAHTLLACALGFGRLCTVRQLLSLGVDFEKAGSLHGMRPLHYACLSTRPAACLRVLLGCGACL